MPLILSVGFANTRLMTYEEVSRGTWMAVNWLSLMCCYCFACSTKEKCALIENSAEAYILPEFTLLQCNIAKSTFFLIVCQYAYHLIVLLNRRNG